MLDELLDEELLEEVVVEEVELLVVVVVVVVELAVELLEALEELPADDEPVALVENGVVCCDEGRELFWTEDSSDVLCGVDVSGSVELSDAEFSPVEELFPEKAVLSDRDAFPASTMFTDPLSPPREQPPSTHIATASDIAAKIFFFIFCSPILYLFVYTFIVIIIIAQVLRIVKCFDEKNRKFQKNNKTRIKHNPHFELIPPSACRNTAPLPVRARTVRRWRCRCRCRSLA